MDTQFSLSQGIQPMLIRSILAQMETLSLVGVMMGVSRFGGVMGEVTGDVDLSPPIGFSL